MSSPDVRIERLALEAQRRNFEMLLREIGDAACCIMDLAPRGLKPSHNDKPVLIEAGFRTTDNRAPHRDGFFGNVGAEVAMVRKVGGEPEIGRKPRASLRDLAVAVADAVLERGLDGDLRAAEPGSRAELRILKTGAVSLALNLGLSTEQRLELDGHDLFRSPEPAPTHEPDPEADNAPSLS